MNSQSVQPLKRGRDYRLLSDFVEHDPAHPTRCHQCEFYGGPYGCTSSQRFNPRRFPIIHHFMKKNKHGWLILPTTPIADLGRTRHELEEGP